MKVYKARETCICCQLKRYNLNMEEGQYMKKLESCLSSDEDDYLHSKEGIDMFESLVYCMPVMSSRAIRAMDGIVHYMEKHHTSGNLSSYLVDRLQRDYLLLVNYKTILLGDRPNIIALRMRIYSSDTYHLYVQCRKLYNFAAPSYRVMIDRMGEMLVDIYNPSSRELV